MDRRHLFFLLMWAMNIHAQHEQETGLTDPDLASLVSTSAPSSPPSCPQSSKVDFHDLVGLGCWTSSRGKKIPIPSRPTCIPPHSDSVVLPVSFSLLRKLPAVQKVQGWTCKKLVVHLKCTSWFFGGHTHTRSETEDLPSLSECINLVNKATHSGVDSLTEGEVGDYPCWYCQTNYQDYPILHLSKITGEIDPDTHEYIHPEMSSHPCLHPNIHCFYLTKIILWNDSSIPRSIFRCKFGVHSTTTGLLDISPDISPFKYVTSDISKIRLTLEDTIPLSHPPCDSDTVLTNFIMKSLEGYFFVFLSGEGSPITLPKTRSARSPLNSSRSTVVDLHFDQSDQISRARRSAPSTPQSDNSQISLSVAQLSWAMDRLSKSTSEDLALLSFESCRRASSLWDIAWSMRTINPVLSVNIWVHGEMWDGFLEGSYMRIWPCVAIASFEYCPKNVELCPGYLPITFRSGSGIGDGWIEGTTGRIFLNQKNIKCGGPGDKMLIPLLSGWLDPAEGKIHPATSYFVNDPMIHRDHVIFDSPPLYDIEEMSGAKIQRDRLRDLSQALSELNWNAPSATLPSSTQGGSNPVKIGWSNRWFGPVAGPYLKFIIQAIGVLIGGTIATVCMKKLVIKLCRRCRRSSGSPADMVIASSSSTSLSSMKQKRSRKWKSMASV